VIKINFHVSLEGPAERNAGFERWYLRYHACEVLSKDQPWIARFVGYRPLPVIPEALEYGHYNMRVMKSGSATWKITSAVPVCSTLPGEAGG